MVGISKLCSHYYRVARKPLARCLTKVCVPVQACRKPCVWMSTLLVAHIQISLLKNSPAPHSVDIQAPTQSTIQTHVHGCSQSSRPQGILGLRKFYWSCFRILKMFHLLAKRFLQFQINWWEPQSYVCCAGLLRAAVSGHWW